jgi:hypothetical protein
MYEVKNLKYNFTEVEIDLIEAHRESNSGIITESKYNGFDFYLMESEAVNSSFRVDRTDNGQRFVRCCVLAINKEYDPCKCFTPLQLQNHLA